MAADTALADWGGTATGSYQENWSAGFLGRTIGQQYQLFWDAVLLPAMNYSASARFQNTQSKATGSPFSWRSEMEPALAAGWTLAFLKLGGFGLYRESRSRITNDKFTGQSYSLAAQSLLKRAPRFSLGMTWDHNVNDLELLGLDTKQRGLSAGTDYTLKALYMQYSYNEFSTYNVKSGFRQASNRHNAQLSWGLRLFEDRLSIQPSFRGNYGTETEKGSLSSTPITAVLPIAGLFKEDPTPEYDSLSVWHTLVDGDLTTSAGAELDLSRNAVLNFGLDFGTDVLIDHLYMYTDTVANPLLPWAVYVSEDNLNWTVSVGYHVYPFNVPLSRYEITFPQRSARYFKLVMRPQPQTQPVHVAELRAFIEQDAQTLKRHNAQQQGAVDIRFQAAQWLSFGVTGWMLQTGRSLTTQDRREQNLSASMSMPFGRVVNLSSRYSLSDIRFRTTATSRLSTEQMSAGWDAKWREELISHLSVSRQREFINQQNIRRQDAATAQLFATFYPELVSRTQVGLSQDRRFQSGDILKSVFARQGVDLVPIPHMLVGVDYGWEKSLTDAGAQSSTTHRSNISLNAGYRLTKNLDLRADGTVSWEPTLTYRSWNGGATWSITPKLSLAGGYSRTDPSNTASSEFYSINISFRVMRKMDWQAGAARSRYGDNPSSNSTDLQTGINVRF